jgi:outer membrane protein assembly factor BamD
MHNRLKILILSILIPPLLSCTSENIKPVPGAKDQYQIAKREYQNKDWSSAVMEFQKLVFNYPGFAKADSAQFLLAMSYYNDKEYPLAAGEFNKLVFSFPTSPLTDDALYYAGICALEQSPKSDLEQQYTHIAIERFQDFLGEYPQSEFVPQVKQKLLEARSKLAAKTYNTAHLYVKMGDYNSALIYLNEILDLYGDTPWASKAFFLLGEVYLKQNKLDRAKDTFQEFIERYPQDKLANKAREKINDIQ